MMGMPVVKILKTGVKIKVKVGVKERSSLSHQCWEAIPQQTRRDISVSSPCFDMPDVRKLAV